MSLDLTFIGQIVVFLTMVILLTKLLYTPLNDAMAARTQRIADGLAAAEAGKNAQADAEAEAKVQIEKAKQTAQEIVAAAERRALAVSEESIAKARHDSEMIVQSAREEAEAEAGRLRQTLRQEVATLAVMAAEKIVEAELDAKKHAALIEKVIGDGVAA
ncbi:MAG: ATP synthase F0 subunit B [Zetaproteobacteria bacterium CG2_30_46_52]|nr:MAG: ATP synthase F0 subunit B [Zetaproteobacteria bacterium CG2_30_46_52]